jgi:hypothetical protein
MASQDSHSVSRRRLICRAPDFTRRATNRKECLLRRRKRSSRWPVDSAPPQIETSEQIYTINLTTLAVDVNDAHRLAHAVLDRLADLPGLLRMSTTVSFEEPINRVMIK